MTVTRPAVWAPIPARVELVAGGRRHPMRQEADGWWHAGVELPPGTDYGFSLDGGDPLPDPRSPWQPAGVHRLSRTVASSTRRLGVRRGAITLVANLGTEPVVRGGDGRAILSWPETIDEMLPPDGVVILDAR